MTTKSGVRTVGADMTAADDDAALAAVALSVSPRTTHIVNELLGLLHDRVDDLHGNEGIAGRLRASIASNVSQLLHLMEQRVPIDMVEPTAGALQLAQQLAQQGIPLSTLWRAYFLCNSRFFVICLHELAGRDGTAVELERAASALSTLFDDYVDHVCSRISTTYEAERDRWIRRQDMVRGERLADVLAGRIQSVSEAETALGYRLRGCHLSVVMWDDSESLGGDKLLGLQRIVCRFGSALGSQEQPLVVPHDASTVWGWVTLPPDTELDPERVLARILTGCDVPFRAALGDPWRSADGFVRSHRTALLAQTVAFAAGAHAPAVVSYSEVGSLTFLCQDLERTRDWVVDTLGTLAADDPAHALLRKSVSAFLDTGGSLSAAAERLGCHKNTVHHRIRRAEEELGRPVRERRMDLELALLASRWFGPGVTGGRG